MHSNANNNRIPMAPFVFLSFSLSLLFFLDYLAVLCFIETECRFDSTLWTISCIAKKKREPNESPIQMIIYHRWSPIEEKTKHILLLNEYFSFSRRELECLIFLYWSVLYIYISSPLLSLSFLEFLFCWCFSYNWESMNIQNDNYNHFHM